MVFSGLFVFGKDEKGLFVPRLEKGERTLHLEKDEKGWPLIFGLFVLKKTKWCLRSSGLLVLKKDGGSSFLSFRKAKGLFVLTKTRFPTSFFVPLEKDEKNSLRSSLILSLFAYLGLRLSCLFVQSQSFGRSALRSLPWSSGERFRFQ